MLLDTSGLFSIVKDDDVNHGEAIRFFETAPVRLLHSYVLAELVALGNATGA